MTPSRTACRPDAQRLSAGPEPAQDTVLDRLKAGTRPAHERLERRLDLLGPGLTPDRYRRVLERFYGFWCAWEPHVAAALGDPAFFEPRRRAHLLEQDLLFLGCDAGRLRALPVCSDDPPLKTRAEALGSLYVLEGSTLGGHVIKRHLERTLALRQGQGCSYFMAYGHETAAMWHSFGRYLLRHAAPQTDEAMIRSARLTFETLERWLCDETALTHAA